MLLHRQHVLTLQIDRLGEDRERWDAAWTDQVAPLQLKTAASWQPVKCYLVKHSWQLLHQRLAQGQAQCVSSISTESLDSLASLFCCSTKTEFSSFCSKRSAGSFLYCFLTFLWQHFSSTLAFAEEDTGILKETHLTPIYTKQILKNQVPSPTFVLQLLDQPGKQWNESSNLHLLCYPCSTWSWRRNISFAHGRWIQRQHLAKNKRPLILLKLVPKASPIYTSWLVMQGTIKYWDLHCVNRKSVEQELTNYHPISLPTTLPHFHGPVSMQGATSSWPVSPCKFEGFYLQDSREREMFLQWPLNMIFLSSSPPVNSFPPTAVQLEVIQYKVTLELHTSGWALNPAFARQPKLTATKERVWWEAKASPHFSWEEG